MAKQARPAHATTTAMTRVITGRDEVSLRKVAALAFFVKPACRHANPAHFHP
jgi:hypothetical protein